MNSPLPMSVELLIPQAGAMRQIETLDAWEPGRGQTGVAAPATGPFVAASGRVAAPALLEMLAQLAAASQGYEALQSSRPPRSGYLVGLKDVVFLDAVYGGEPLDLEIVRTFQMDDAAMLEGTLRRDNATVVRGVFKVWERDSHPEALPTGSSPAGSPEMDLPVSRCALPGDPRDARGGGYPVRSALLRSVRRWDAAGDAGVDVGFAFGGDFPGFSGHFPGFPILPAVCMLDAVLLAVEIASGRVWDLAGVDQAKFSRLVFPGEGIDMGVKWAAGEEGLDVSARFACGDAAVARIRLAVREPRD